MISRNAGLFLFGSFFVNFLFAIYVLIFNLYLRELGFTESMIGRVLSSVAIGSMVASIPCALLIARYAIKGMLLVTTGLLVGAFFLMITVTEPFLVVIAGFFMGSLISFSRVASAPLFMRNSTREERTYLFSLNFTNWMFAGIIGSYLGGHAQEWYAANIQPGPDSYRFVLLGAMAVALLAMIPFAMIRARPPAKEERKLVLNRKLLKEQGAVLFKLTFPFFLVGAGAGLIIPFLNLYFRDVFNMSTEQIGVYYAAVQLSMIVGTMSGPVLVRHIGMVRTLVFTEVASIPFMLVMAFSGNVQLVVIAFLCRGALMNMGQPIGTNFAMEMVPEQVHALANSLMMIAWTSSWAVSTQLGGWVIEHHGYIPSFLLTIGFYMSSAFLYYYYFSKTEAREGRTYRISTTSKPDFG